MGIQHEGTRAVRNRWEFDLRSIAAVLIPCTQGTKTPRLLDWIVLLLLKVMYIITETLPRGSCNYVKHINVYANSKKVYSIIRHVFFCERAGLASYVGLCTCKLE